MDGLIGRALVLLLPLAIACTSSADPASSPTPPSPVSPSPSQTPEPPVYVAVKGDWGSGTSAQRAVTRRMCAVRKVRPFDVVVTTGDNFYEPDGRATDRNFHEPESCLTSYPGHRWRASWGNHDVPGPDTRRVLGASGFERWRTGGALFVALDSNRVADREQRRSLRRALAASDEAIKIVYFHHSPFTANSVHAPSRSVRRTWVPLFERYGVTLVLTGHSHGYEHHEVSGVHYVVTAGGGAVMYRCEGAPRSLRRCESYHHFLLLQLEPTEVTVTAIDTAGDEIDRFTIEV